MYSQIKSDYIKGLIKGLDRSQKQMIDDLMILYKYITQGPNGRASHMHYNMLRFEYKDHYLELLKENNPEKYRLYLETQDSKEISIKNENDFQDEWLKLGGVI